jgi:uncharacterized delta-60 repeat protein
MNKPHSEYDSARSMPQRRCLRALLAAALIGASCLHGFAASADEVRFAVAAYNGYGNLEPSVAGGGKFATTFPPNVGAIARAAAVDPILGRLYVAGTAGNENIAIARYDYGGNLDPNFGSGGRVLTPYEYSGKFSIRDLAIDSSNRIVVVGYHGKAVLIARYFSDGTLDSSFGGDGIVEFAPAGEYEYFRGLAVAITGGRAGDRIVISGDAQRQDCEYGGFGFDGGMLIARFLPNGQPDPAFGYGQGFQGFVIDNLLPKYCGYDKSSGVTWHHYEEARDVAVDAQGRIVIAGVQALDMHETKDDPPGVYDMRSMQVRRYLPNGESDVAFGPGPFNVAEPFSNFGNSPLTSHGNALLIEPGGKIVVAGQARWAGPDCFALARITAQGTLDDSFSGDGRTLSCFGTFGTSEVKVIAPAVGGVLAGGWVGTPDGDNQRFALARYRDDGNLDTAFGGDGKVATDFTCKGNEVVEALAIKPYLFQVYDRSFERIFAAGWSEGDPCGIEPMAAR